MGNIERWLIEIFGLWLPIAFHSLLGVAYAVGGKPNATKYAYKANRRYVLQRVSGYIGFVFIFYHVATLRWGWTFLVPAAQSGPAPTLIRIQTKAGHGAGKPTSMRIEEATDIIGFLVKSLDMKLN